MYAIFQLVVYVVSYCDNALQQPVVGPLRDRCFKFYSLDIKIINIKKKKNGIRKHHASICIWNIIKWTISYISIILHVKINSEEFFFSTEQEILDQFWISKTVKIDQKLSIYKKKIIRIKA